MIKDISNVGLLCDVLHEVLGEAAPVKRRFLLDFKGPDGQDRNTDLYAICTPEVTDKVLVLMFKEQIAKEGGKLSALSELISDTVGRPIWATRAFIAEIIEEQHLKAPADLEAAMLAVGLDPAILEG